ncbi:TetR/AcrR family transcriptional regulator [Thiosulfatihalobacter marinus]|uniref:TetR/AcrR family transcriptional regulator n=2 Tax=Thiosulfatihalobacter marinus TaxID=2792481 RepID=UPI0018D76E1D|nr:TetR/AcrR family transcriptional regulator [Thiosulfatihalobacter marinus]
MSSGIPPEKQRQRAPSKRALATRERIMDAAEQVFAAHGFEGASLREIAARAGVQVALVNHHGGAKEDLFWRVVARRADELSAARLDALAARKARGALTLTAVMECFLAPYLSKAETGGAQWFAYARLVAVVSADPRWRDLCAHCFDPTAGRFVAEIAALYPTCPRQTVSAGFVYSVSAMLALLTSRWRISALGDGASDTCEHLDELVTFCSAGIDAIARRQLPPFAAPAQPL